MKKASKAEEFNHNHHAHPPVPILDEVNNLLKKEKILYELKMTESKQQADEWRFKYEKLLGEVADTAKVTGNYQTYEIAAGIETEYFDFDSSLYHDMNKFLQASGLSALDLSNKYLRKSDISDIIISLKEMNKPFPIALLMSKNKLSDKNSSSNDRSSNADLLGALISIPHIDAIDFSYNELGTGFENTLIESLRMKKKSPQYVLLNGNMQMSLCPHLYDIFALLSDRSWGIAVSLEDMAEVKDAQQPTHKIHATSNEFNIGSHKSMRCHEFLRILNLKLEQYALGVNAIEFAEKKQKAKANSKTSKTSSIEMTSKRIRAIERRPGGLQLMSVLGLTDTCLSKKSIESLATTLKLSISSLTDLDLSFSFTGQLGAQLIRDSLKDPNCQLVRIGMAGNNLKDKGVQIIQSSLVANKTLTYLDLKSNYVTKVGLDCLMEIFSKKVIVPPLTSTDASVTFVGSCLNLRTIDFTGNEISLQDKMNADKIILNSGRDFHIKFISMKDALVSPPDAKKSVYDKSETSHSKDNKHAATATATALLYASPHMVSCEIISGPAHEKRLYSIDSRHLLPHLASRKREGFAVEWYMRIGGGEFSSSKFLNSAKQKKNDEKSDIKTSDDSKVLKSRISPGMRWEIRYSTPKGEKVEVESRVCSTAGFSSSEWILCRGHVLSEPPSRGYLEIWAIMERRPVTLLEAHGLLIYSTPQIISANTTRSTSSTSTLDSNKENKEIISPVVSSSEGEHNLNHLDLAKDPDGHRFVGGDILEWSNGVNSLISNISLDDLNSPSGFIGLNYSSIGEANQLLPKGYIPLRALRWTLPLSSAKVTFKMKLSPIDGIGDATDINNTSSSSDGNKSLIMDPFSRSSGSIDHHIACTLGYSWRVSVFSSNGTCSNYEYEGRSLSQNKTLDSTTTTTNNNIAAAASSASSAKRPNPLLPWIWQSYDFDLGPLTFNDIVVISGTPEADSPNSTALSRCSVQIKDCKLLATSSDLHSVSKFYDICGAGASNNFPDEYGKFSKFLNPSTTSISYAVHNDPRVRLI